MFASFDEFISISGVAISTKVHEALFGLLETLVSKGDDG